ncbi:hypothetical protein JTE90_006538 [Oedothorax gibbosus]|uniref:Platelet-derived growth factor (PDGF) family profile domain-containing protein n=1 Tax=Oedothorax gibbosus TaxID=931172 RepID=A0AAV6VKP3_9ARAC|nr:hypothetical protein JTE90_006538 [Oedothorax gibbosus]
MEWCRMFSLRIVVCTLLLGCGLCYPASNSTSKREQKRQELLKMLGGYTPTHAKVLSSVENTLEHDKHDLTHPSLPKTTEKPRLSPVDGEESGEESVKFPDMGDISTYRDYMERIYGTQEGIDFLKKNYGPTGLDRARAKFGKKIYREHEDVRLANAHYRRMAQKTRCRIPVPQLVRVRDFYPDPSKDYAPECTILHRCSDTTGCCAKGLHCVPTDVQEVALHFFNIHPGKTETVRLLFENHTSCECRPINDMPRLQEDDGNHLLDRKDPHSRKKEYTEGRIFRRNIQKGIQ